MNIKPNKSVYDYVAQIEHSLRMSRRHSTVKGGGLDSPKARANRLNSWEKDARKVGISEEIISQVRKEFTRKHGT